MRFTSLDRWPVAGTKNRRNSPFRAGYQDTLERLEKEIENLSGRNVVVGLCLGPADFRNDGWPRAGAKPAHPSVIVSFETPKLGALRIHCDAFPDFRANLRAVAMHLEHLRMAGLYGVGRDGEQYRGWRALPEPAEASGSGTSGTEAAGAAALIAREAGVGPPIAAEIQTDPESLDYYGRIAAKMTHPDGGGSHERFLAVQAARELLRGMVN